MKITVTDIASHRNGICGESFYVVLFDWKDDDGKTRNMIGHVFRGSVPDDDGKVYDDGCPRVAVLDRAMLTADNIAFGENSWRGDHFSDALVAAIQDDNRRKYGAA